MYKIKTLGANGNILCQLPRINKGFLDLRHELVDDGECSFIYANDKGYHSEAIEYKKKYPKAKLILNTLDLARNCREHRDICDQLSLNFYFSDAVTTISNTVKEQMISTFPHTQKRGIDVVYQPIKNVKPLKLERGKNLMCLGRILDPNKRVNLAIQATQLYGGILDIYGSDDITNFIGKEYRKIVNYKGLVSDEELEIAYNTHAAILVTSFEEGLCLPICESLASKTPLVCVSDCTTSKEFCPPEFICEPNPFAIADKIKYVISGTDKINKILDDYSNRYSKQFSSESVAHNIVKVFENLK